MEFSRSDCVQWSRVVTEQRDGASVLALFGSRGGGDKRASLWALHRDRCGTVVVECLVSEGCSGVTEVWVIGLFVDWLV